MILFCAIFEILFFVNVPTKKKNSATKDVFMLNILSKPLLHKINPTAVIITHNTF